jgi:hypothetical protein
VASLHAVVGYALLMSIATWSGTHGRWKPGSSRNPSGDRRHRRFSP